MTKSVPECFFAPAIQKDQIGSEVFFIAPAIKNMPKESKG